MHISCGPNGIMKPHHSDTVTINSKVNPDLLEPYVKPII